MWDFIGFTVKLFSSIIFVIFQQGFVVFIGFILYSQTAPWAGYLVWSLVFPMFYLNYLTVKYIFKYGFVDFITKNADTSEIDVKQDERIWPKD